MYTVAYSSLGPVEQLLQLTACQAGCCVYAGMEQQQQAELASAAQVTEAQMAEADLEMFAKLKALFELCQQQQVFL